jgi:hypothetical protein
MLSKSKTKNLLDIPTFNEVVKSFDCCYRGRANDFQFNILCFICTQRAIWIIFLLLYVIRSWNDKSSEKEDKKIEIIKLKRKDVPHFPWSFYAFEFIFYSLYHKLFIFSSSSFLHPTFCKVDFLIRFSDEDCWRERRKFLSKTFDLSNEEEKLEGANRFTTLSKNPFKIYYPNSNYIHIVFTSKLVSIKAKAKKTKIGIERKQPYKLDFSKASRFFLSYVW